MHRRHLLALAPLALLIAASAAPPHVRPAQAPAAPPDGTYVYALSRNGTDQGLTTITLYRRDASSEIETDESGYVGAAHARIVAAYRYADLVADSYVGTYRAPFLTTSTIGQAFGARARSWSDRPVIVRYRVEGGGATATIDGVAQARTWPAPPASPKPGFRARSIFDAPFVSSVVLVPAYRHKSGDTVFAPAGLAFDEGVDLASERVVAAAPRSPKTPKTDTALELRGLGTIWFNRGDDIVDEVHFEALNLDARLIAYSRTPAPPSPDPETTPVPRAHLQSRPFAFSGDDDTKLSGTIDLPASGKARAPTIVFVPPGPDADRNYADEGPEPMYPSLALAFAARGYAVVRYDGRNAGRSPAAQPATWETSLSDARAAVAAASGDDAVDADRIYVLGYGIGADLALVAASAPDAAVAGAIALGPTVTSYRECAKRTHAATDGAFFKSAAVHDPGALAARIRVPAFVLHAGARCGESKLETTAYDDRLRAADPRATIVVASDLSAQFGGLYDADASLDTEAFFPYRFDASTADAIADWLDNPKGVTGSSLPRASGIRPPAPPAPPPVADPELNGEMPNPHLTATPESEVAPGVVLPSGVTPPPVQVEPPTPSPTPSPSPTAG